MNTPCSPESGRPVRVLVVDDSPTVLELLVHVLEADPSIRVIGTARDGEEAVEAVSRRRPDVVTMDVHMPNMDGLTATRKIMQNTPVPIVILSSSANFDPDQAATCFTAMEAGAVGVAKKPPGIGHPEHEENARRLLQTLKLMSEVKVVRRRPAFERTPSPRPHVPRVKTEPRVVAIGASTGGPPVIASILSHLPGDFPVPLLIVQHIASGFAEGFVKWLNDAARFPVHFAEHGTEARPGNAYVAPDGFLMGVDSGNRITLLRNTATKGNNVSVSHLFSSVAGACGSHAVGILLSGMGRDGAEELKAMRKQGALTIAQDRESSVIYGMPGEAEKIGAARYILPPERIVELLINAVKRG